MKRRSSSKTNTRSRAIDEDGIRLSFSEANAQSESTDDDGIGPSWWIGGRDVYEIGPVALFAELEVETHRVILVQRELGRSTIIPLNTADEVQRLVRFLTKAQKYLPL